MLVIVLPIALAALAMGQLGQRYEEFATYFFTSLAVKEQVAILTLIFSVMFAAIGISNQLSGAGKEKPVYGTTKTGIKTINITNNTTSTTMAYPLHDLNQAISDRAKFAALYPWLRDTVILDTLKQNHPLLPDSSLEYLSRMMDYTCQGGKFHRGTTLMSVYRQLQPNSLTTTELAQAATLGWTIEILQAFFLVADDVMDSSLTRRGQPCWYQQPHVQLKAINDAFLLESFVFTILKTCFGSLPCYGRLVSLLLEGVQTTELGQFMDLTSTRKGEPVDISLFTMERYRAIVQYKTTYYSFYLPVALAMALAGITNDEAYRQAKLITTKMGEYFQIQDDVLDCFGNGKGRGTDIQDNKCTWLIVKALEKCTLSQRQKLEDHYGVPIDNDDDDDDDDVQQVKQIYRDLKLDDDFQTYVETSWTDIQQLLGDLKGIPPDIFQLQLKKIYKRVRKKS